MAHVINNEIFSLLLNVSIFNAFFLFRIEFALTQPAITFSKLTTETLEQGVKYVQS